MQAAGGGAGDGLLGGEPGLGGGEGDHHGARHAQPLAHQETWGGAARVRWHTDRELGFLVNRNTINLLLVNRNTINMQLVNRNTINLVQWSKRFGKNTKQKSAEFGVWKQIIWESRQSEAR